MAPRVANSAKEPKVPNRAEKKAKAKSITATERAGLVLAPARIKRIMVSELPSKFRVSGLASVYLAGVLEALGTHILKKAGLVCLDKKRKSVSGKHIGVVLRRDPWINKTQLSQALITGQWALPVMQRVQLVTRRERAA